MQKGWGENNREHREKIQPGHGHGNNFVRTVVEQTTGDPATGCSFRLRNTAT
jgi:hypothetical protein